tara:strand:+ start:3461 stop:5140 length:1680 start_codon:yes stop_codon:yes gene_type:complete
MAKNSVKKRKVDQRKDKIRAWLSDRTNLIFLGILVFAIGIRLFYFSLTKGQALWWDEADYLAYAKNLANLGGDWIVTEQHNSVFPFIVAALLSVGFNEVASKFFVELLPSVFVVLISYLLIRKMYPDPRIALVCAFLMSVFWVSLFNTNRFHLGMPGLLFGLLAVYAFWEGWERREKIFGRWKKEWTIPIAVALVVFTYTIRRGYFLFGAFILAYMALTGDWRKMVRDKKNWVGVGLLLVLFYIAEKLIFTTSIGGVAESYTHVDQPLRLIAFDVFKSYFALGSGVGSVLFYLFWLGLILVIVNLGLNTGYIKKSKDPNLKADLFNLISIILTLAFFIFILRPQNIFGEARWYLPLALPAFVCIARVTTYLADKTKRYHKILPVLVIVLLIGAGGWYQYGQADSIIRGRVDSFSGIKEAGSFVNGISKINEIIISQAVPQTVYYSERNVLQAEMLVEVKGKDFTLEDFLEAVSDNKDVKFLLVSFSEPGQPDWMRRDSYVQDQGQVKLAAWEIPFMDSKIDFINQQQNIRGDKTFGEQGLKFTLVEVKQDIFIYLIERV